MSPVDYLPPINPQGLPAPVWFLQLFKLIGFILHLWPMHLFFAGALLAAVMAFRGSPHGTALSGRLGRVLPFAVALGVNFGIVPLLFVQVTHYRVFYPATILMAWPWFSIFGLLTLGYYGLYLYAWQVRHNRVNQLGRGVFFVASLFFVLIGFLFANAFSLLVNVPGWARLMEATSVSGAYTGLALNLGDPTLLPRWLMMFGLALCSTAAWLAIDAAFFCAGEDSYQAYARRFALRLYAAGTAAFALFGSWYIFGALPADARAFLVGGARLPLFLLTGGAPVLGLAAIAWASQPTAPRRAWAVAGAHFVVLALNAISRQMLQTHELTPYNIVGAEPVRTQWATLPLFLICFVGAVALLGWMLRRVWVEWHQQPAEGEPVA